MIEHLFKVVAIVLAAVIGFVLAPVNDNAVLSAVVFALTALLVSLIFLVLEHSSAGMIFGGIAGLVVGAITAWLVNSLISEPLTYLVPGIGPSIRMLIGLLLIALGAVYGYNRGSWLTPHNIKAMMNVEEERKAYKILDTSVIIDGRVVDICETGFMGGILVVPQFILKELQQIADSGQSLKRNRGRRGLDVLQKLKKMNGVNIIFPEQDFPEVQEVDLKLIELARLLNAKVVTNDFNLNKVAQLRGVEVLNINELANALKPVVLPGELMNILILKEGKEANQGIGYLDDGTMVVVDNSSHLINQNVQLMVTSVLQTSAGKMIFGKTDEGRADHLTHQG